MIVWLVVTLVVVFLAYIIHVLRPRPLDGVPHPPGYSAITGDALSLQKNRERYLHWHMETSVHFNMGPWQLTVPGRGSNIKVSDPKIIEYVLKTKIDNYVKVRTQTDRRMYSDLVGWHGMFIADGAEWTSIRKSCSYLFSNTVLKDFMFRPFVDNAIVIHSLLEKLKPDEPINMQEIFFKYTYDSFMLIAFGDNPGSLLKEHDEFAEAFERLQQGVMTNLIEPQFMMYLKTLVGHPMAKQTVADRKLTRAYASRVMQERRAELKEGQMGSSRKFSTNLISLFLSRAADKGEELTDDWLTDQLMTMLLAGRDTTASILTSMCILLSQHPEVQAKLLDELDTQLKGELPTFESVKNMKYSEAVFNEALRLFPPAPCEARKALHDDVLPDGTKIPAGAEVQWLPWVIGKNPAVFENPLEFNPERWLGEHSLPKPDSFAWPAFNAGPRSCLGKGMSYLEARVCLSMCLQQYTLRLVPGQSLQDFELGLTLGRKGGVFFTAHPREVPCAW